ncbi:MAG: hypothetical protein ACTSPY_09770 [Candidatus Helarchaeota archaeon]
MGLLSRFKEFFAGKPIETFKELEKDVNKLYKKCDSSLIALIGTAAKIKGLLLIYFTKDENYARLIAAKIPQIIDSIKIFNNKEFTEIRIYYNDELVFLKQILDNISFVAIYKQKNDIYLIRQWIYNKLNILKTLFERE